MTKFQWEKKVVPTVYYRMSSHEEEQARKRRLREQAELDAMVARDIARWMTPKNNLPKPPKKRRR